MGLGDELMAAGEARRLYEQTGNPSVILDARKMVRKHELWAGNPHIVYRFTPGRCNRVISGSGVRPYIKSKSPERWTWTTYAPYPALMIFTSDELQFADKHKGHVVVEPNVKDVGHANKAWVKERWQDLVARFPPGTFLQLRASNHVPVLPGAQWVQTPSFRHALAVLAVSRGYVGTEGGLMHGAAAVGAPAVILWSEFIAPNITGYAAHTNIRHAGEPCGRRTDCPGCRKSMEAITVDEVTDAVRVKISSVPRFAPGQTVYLAGSGGPLKRADPLLVERVHAGRPPRYTLSTIKGGHYEQVPEYMLDAYKPPTTRGRT